MGGRDSGGHDRLDVSLVLAWGRMLVDRGKVESRLTNVVERGLCCLHLEPATHQKKETRLQVAGERVRS
jgi:hypothetical protein